MTDKSSFDCSHGDLCLRSHSKFNSDMEENAALIFDLYDTVNVIDEHRFTCRCAYVRSNRYRVRKHNNAAGSQ